MIKGGNSFLKFKFAHKPISKTLDLLQQSLLLMCLIHTLPTMSFNFVVLLPTNLEIVGSPARIVFFLVQKKSWLINMIKHYALEKLCQWLGGHMKSQIKWWLELVTICRIL